MSMTLYQVTINSEEDRTVVSQRLEEQYKDAHYPLVNGFSWVVAENSGSITSSIAEKVLNYRDSAADQPQVSGIVVKIEAYNGLYNPDLWEQMREWARA